jgi:hypothetical protein
VPRDSRHACRRGERERSGFRKGVNEISGKVFEDTRDLVGVLLEAKMRALQTYPT